VFSFSKVLATIYHDINTEISLIPSEEWIFLSFCRLEFNVYVESTEPLSVLQFTVAAVKCIIDFITSPALVTDFLTFIKSLCALDIIPRHPKYVALLLTLMPC
jgi:hypothetical protein